MLRISLCTLLISTVLFQSFAAAQTGAAAQAPASSGIAEQVRALPAGSRLQADLSNGDRITGTLSEVTAAGFELRNISHGKVLQSWDLAFQDVQSVQRKPLPSKNWQVVKWSLVAAGVVGAAVAIVFAASAAHN